MSAKSALRDAQADVRPEGFFSSSMSDWAVSLPVKTTMRQPGLPEGHSNATVTAHVCDCRCDDLPHGLAAGVMVKRTTGRSAVQGKESKFLQSRSASLGDQIRAAQALWGSKLGAFHIEQASSGQTPIFS